MMKRNSPQVMVLVVLYWKILFRKGMKVCFK
jgi:hypothetical protein